MATRCWWSWDASATTARCARGEARILRVLTRGNPTVVGTFHYGSRQNYVTPIDEKVTREIIIPRGMEWPADERTPTRRAHAFQTCRCA